MYRFQISPSSQSCSPQSCSQMQAPSVSNNSEPSDDMICFCHEVRHSELVQTIRRGACTLKQIQRETLASTGCGGCYERVEEILASELPPGS